MTRDVDRDRLALYLMGELDDSGCAQVEALVASDPRWAAALQEEAQVELTMFEVADEAAKPVAPSPQPRASVWTRWAPAWRGATGLILGAAVLMFFCADACGRASSL
jgi:anti-sigma factor RsiW